MCPLNCTDISSVDQFGLRTPCGSTLRNITDDRSSAQPVKGAEYDPAKSGYIAALAVLVFLVVFGITFIIYKHAVQTNAKVAARPNITPGSVPQHVDRATFNAALAKAKAACKYDAHLLEALETAWRVRQKAMAHPFADHPEKHRQPVLAYIRETMPNTKPCLRRGLAKIAADVRAIRIHAKTSTTGAAPCLESALVVANDLDLHLQEAHHELKAAPADGEYVLADTAQQMYGGVPVGEQRTVPLGQPGMPKKPKWYESGGIQQSRPLDPIVGTAVRIPAAYQSVQLNPSRGTARVNPQGYKHRPLGI